MDGEPDRPPGCRDHRARAAHARPCEPHPRRGARRDLGPDGGAVARLPPLRARLRTHGAAIAAATGAGPTRQGVSSPICQAPTILHSYIRPMIALPVITTAMVVGVMPASRAI